MCRQSLLHPDTVTALATLAEAHPNHTDLQRHCARGIANVAAVPLYRTRALQVLQPTVIRMLGVRVCVRACACVCVCARAVEPLHERGISQINSVDVSRLVLVMQEGQLAWRTLKKMNECHAALQKKQTPSPEPAQELYFPLTTVACRRC